MRNVLKNTNEVCHFWANKVQDSGKAGSIFFDKNCIFSYGYHYVIAKYVNDINGREICLLNDSGYSVTTAKHTSLVSRSIPYDKTVFNVPDINRYTINHEKNVKYYIGKISENLQKSVKARANSEYLINGAKRWQNMLMQYAIAFNLSYPEIENFTEYCHNEIIVTDEFKDNIKQAEKLRQAKILEKKKENINEWLNGSSNYLTNSVNKVFLRLSSDKENIETSKGANVPLKAGKILYNLLQLEDKVNGHNIGNYKVISNTNELLTIGCHKIERKEINRFASLMNW